MLSVLLRYRAVIRGLVERPDRIADQTYLSAAFVTETARARLAMHAERVIEFTHFLLLDRARDNLNIGNFEDCRGNPSR